MTTAARHDVIVIGGGLNGLTLTALLARRGRSVLLLERAPVLGGTAAGRTFHQQRVSAGLIHECRGLRPAVSAELDLDGHGLTRCDEAIFTPSPAGQGDGLLLAADPSGAASELGFCRDADRYAAYRRLFTRLARFTDRLFEGLPPDLGADGVAAMTGLLKDGAALRRLGRRDMMELLRIAPMCVADWLDEQFESDRLKSMLATPAVGGTFMGPRSPGSVTNLLRWEAAAAAGAACRPATLVSALTAAAKGHGAAIRTDAAVTAIRCHAGRAVGVTLADGSTHDAGWVASTVDARTTFLDLIEGAECSTRFEHRLHAFRMRGTTAQVNLAIDGDLQLDCRPELTLTRIRTAQTLIEMERAFDAVKYGTCSPQPFLEIDATQPGVLSILVHFAPFDLDGGWTDETRGVLRERVVERLSAYASSLPGSIVAEEVLAPPDIAERYGVTGGHIHQGELALDQLIDRPCPECARYGTPIDNLLLCGGSTHPGGGLAGVSGAIAASIIAPSSRG